MEVIGRGGDGNYLCRFLPMNMLLFHMRSVDIDTAWRSTPSCPSEVIKTE